MVDTITTYAGDKESVTPIDAQPDPREPSRRIIANMRGQPLRGKLSLGDHAYNVLLLPGSFVIIDADEAEMFKDSQSDDRVIFILPSDDSSEFRIEQYITGAQGQSPYTALVLWHYEKSKIISAALYPRDLADLPPPAFRTPGGNTTFVAPKDKAEASAEAGVNTRSHSPRDLEFILRAVHQQDKKSGLDPNMPKESWF